MRVWWLLVVVPACGRIDFDPLGTPPPETDAPAATTPCAELPGILFCDGFEGGNQLGAEQATPPSFVIADAEQVYRGSLALHARTTRATEPAWRLGSVLPALTSGELHARWYHYFPSASTNRTIASLHFVADTAPNGGVVFGLTDGNVDVTATSNGEIDIANIALPLDRWTCIQLRIALSPTGTVESFVDGTPGARLDNVDTAPPGGIENIHAGLFAGGDASSVIDLWTDELAVGTQPIACD